VTGNKSTLMQSTLAYSDPRKQITHLYVSFLGRNPSEAELSSMQQQLAKDVSPGDLAWALLNTREFIFIQ
jgi:hypothetical protein